MQDDRAPWDVEGGLFRLSVARYHAMQSTGILGADDRVELLDGLLVSKTRKLPAHAAAGRFVRDALARVVGVGYLVCTQDPLTTADSEPEPDVMVVRGSGLDYRLRHPEPHEVPLVVEVSDTSLRLDRGIKLAVYAAAGIERYWIVDLRARVVESFHGPDGIGYAHRAEHAEGSVIPVVLDGIEIARIEVASLLP